MQEKTIATDENSLGKVFRAFLVGTFTPPETSADASEFLTELSELVTTLGVPTAGQMIVQVKVPNPRYYVGSGKAEEIRDAADAVEANVIVFDTPLGPTQQRNLETVCQRKVIDRQEVILDIFAQRARTREAVLQVELARYRYFLPRLTGAWTHLSRQKGGNTGARGEGEKQIELDRRALKHKISELEEDLAEVRKQRIVQRKERIRNAIPNAAIVGYTNAGKTTLLNALTGADAFAADQLFATLDPTTRRLMLPDKSELLLTDTVGFVRKLPHSLVEAFKATLEEAVLADFIVLVLDSSSPAVMSHLETTLAVLAELGADRKHMITVFNKCELEQDPLTLLKLETAVPNAIFISCRTGEGMDRLKDEFVRMAGNGNQVVHVTLPPQESGLIAKLHAKCSILESRYLADGTFTAAAVISKANYPYFAEYIESDTNLRSTF